MLTKREVHVCGFRVLSSTSGVVFYCFHMHRLSSVVACTKLSGVENLNLDQPSNSQEGLQIVSVASTGGKGTVSPVTPCLEGGLGCL